MKLRLPSLPRNIPLDLDDVNKTRPTTSKVTVKQDKTQVYGMDSYKYYIILKKNIFNKVNLICL